MGSALFAADTALGSDLYCLSGRLFLADKPLGLERRARAQVGGAGTEVGRDFRREYIIRSRIA